MPEASPPEPNPIDARIPALAALRGQALGTSDWKLIDQEAIDAFSGLTDDGGPIHNDPVKAAEVAPYGGTIVQGFFMLACLTGFAKNLRLPDGAVFRLNYGFDKVRILAPVPVDTRVRGHFVLQDLVARGADGALMTMEASIEAEGIDRPAIVAEWLAYLQLHPES